MYNDGGESHYLLHTGTDQVFLFPEVISDAYNIQANVGQIHEVAFVV